MTRFRPLPASSTEDDLTVGDAAATTRVTDDPRPVTDSNTTAVTPVTTDETSTTKVDETSTTEAEAPATTGADVVETTVDATEPVGAAEDPGAVPDAGGPGGPDDPGGRGDRGKPDKPDGEAVGGARRVRQILGWVVTVVAALLVYESLIAPNYLRGYERPSGYLGLPLEGIIGAGVLWALPVRARRVVAAVIGAFLGLLTILKLLDAGFLVNLGRTFNPVIDWVLFDDAYSFLIDSVGRAGAIGAAVAAVLIALAVPALLVLSMLRLTTVITRHRRGTLYSVGTAAVAWMLLAVLGVQVAPNVPAAAQTTAIYTYRRTELIRAGLRDKDEFAASAKIDAFRDVPADKLLTALRGKDVVIAFVESYGRSAIEDPALAPQIGGVLDTGTQRLKDAGFGARSGFLTSPTTGGGSWLAHSTFQSGLWINNQQRYRTLTASDRLTLPSFFGRASWQTVGVEPGNTKFWPEGLFYGYQHVYDSRNLGYHGSKFSWSTMPDQYTLSAFDKLVYRKPGRGPLLADITLTSSHTPWAPIPHTIPWDQVGDGSVYAAMAREGKRPSVVWRDPQKLRVEYRKSIGYTLNSIVSYVANFANPNLVLIVLGDHQPSSIIVGENASRDVPIAIISHDPAVLNKVSGWGWQDGLKPGKQAPVWPMNAFRDKFLTTFSTP